MSTREYALKTFLAETGYETTGPTSIEIKMITDDEYVLIKPLMFHWTMIRGNILDLNTYDDRWCYADQTKAEAAFAAFPENPAPDYEPDGWHRHPTTGRRREDGDPEAERIAF